MTGLDHARDLALRLRGRWRRSLSDPLWGRSAILSIQRVLPSEAEARLPHRATWCLGPQSFEQLLLGLSDMARLVSLATALRPHRDAAPRIALTFDAAWRDNVDVAMPRLDHYAIPAHIFLHPERLAHPQGEWRETIGEGLWHRQRPERIRDVLGDAGLPTPPLPPRRPGLAYSRVLAGYLAQLEMSDTRRLDEVGDHLCEELDRAPAGLDPFTVRRLEADGLTYFGAGGLRLGELESQSNDDIDRQLRRLRQGVGRLCRHPLPVLAYPDRSPPSARVQTLIQRCGVPSALAGSGGWLDHTSTPLALPRIPLGQAVAQSPGRLYDYLLGLL